MNNKNPWIVPSAILSVSIIISVIIFSLVWKSARTAEQTITVTGSAKIPIVSDFAIIQGSVKVEERNAQGAFKNLKTSIPILSKFLKERGVKEEQVDFLHIDKYEQYRIGLNGYQTQEILKYVYQQRLKIELDDVNKAKELSLELNSLVEKGINFTVESTQYHFSKLADMKADIQAMAAQNAQLRADKIATATGRKLGPLRKARMGVLQITPSNSTMISDYGYNDMSSIEKDITAVVSASFEIE
ncbi:MAG: SIMPL domain-containing protein [Melioribacteraceae bacterium]|nr:SIMPL domain-containing protein [Melioribacteraceae bacterium]